jgi:hypothetical protein
MLITGVPDMDTHGLAPVMNNTKWEELRLAMYSLGPLHPKWRTKDVETGYIPEWDGEWFYHFRDGGYESIEWVEIRITSPEQDQAVLCALRSIHVAGERTAEGYRIFGYAEPGKALNYIE